MMEHMEMKIRILVRYACARPAAAYLLGTG